MMKSRKNYLKRFTNSPNGMNRKTTPYKQLPLLMFCFRQCGQRQHRIELGFDRILIEFI